MNKLYLFKEKFSVHKNFILPWVIALVIFLLVCVYILKSITYANSVITEMHSTVNDFEYMGLAKISTYQSGRFAGTAEVTGKYTLRDGVSSDLLLHYYCGDFSEKVASHWDKEGFWDNDKVFEKNCDLSHSLDNWTIYWCSKPRRIRVYVRFGDILDYQGSHNVLEISASSRLEYFSESSCE